MRGSQRITRYFRAHLTAAQDEVRQDREDRATRGVLDTPDGKPTQPDTGIMGVACETPTATTGRLVGVLKAEGEEESAHEFYKGLAIAKQLNVRRVVSTIDRDSAVFAGLFGCCAPVSPPGHQVSSADETRWG